jgi:hypothetical protein
MNQLGFDSLHRFLASARWPSLPTAEPTFFTVAGIERKELPLSNVYAFFFRSTEKHGLRMLFGEALLAVIKAKQPLPIGFPETIGQLQVAREYPMNDGQRLDLLLHDGFTQGSVDGATFAILVENKIDHWLTNNITNYWDSISHDLPKIGVVLGLRDEHPTKPWVFVSHLELARAVEQRLGPIISRINPRYLPILLHFLEYLKQMSNAHDELSTIFTFIQRHRQELAQAHGLLAYLKPERFAQTIADAFGSGYAETQVLADYPRVRIHPTATKRIDYLVWFGNVLDLNAKPEFSITLWPGENMAKETRSELRQMLLAQSAAQGTGIIRPSWFSDEKWFDIMLAGKDYPFYGTTLTDLEQQVREAFQTDWLPMESSWLSLPIAV